MDRNSKIAFGLCGSLWIWGMYKQFLLYRQVQMLEACIDMVDQVLDPIFQKNVDEKFEDIVDRFDDD